MGSHEVARDQMYRVTPLGNSPDFAPAEDTQSQTYFIYHVLSGLVKTAKS